MKQHQTEYSENSITYWPSYEAGRIGSIMLLVLGFIFIATSIWILLDKPSSETRLEILIALPILIVALCAVLCIVFRTMRTKVVVSNAGIERFKNNVSIETQIRWEDVSAVYFSQELWYGRKSCRIYIKKAVTQKPYEQDGCDFVLPVFAVDEQKLLQLIPNYLWKNNPWHI